MLKQILFM